jgi:hypothetical protein
MLLRFAGKGSLMNVVLLVIAAVGDYFAFKQIDKGLK